MKKQVFCKLEIEGIHRWDGCDIPEVEYLKNDHRHLFFIKAIADVTHSNRCIEFIKLKHQIEDYVKIVYWRDDYQCCYFGSMSCEMIAEELINRFNLSSCEVSEDDENGCILTKE
jgi:hypothetical protein